MIVQDQMLFGCVDVENLARQHSVPNNLYINKINKHFGTEGVQDTHVTFILLCSLANHDQWSGRTGS